jgi:hypothetical protein
MEMPLEVIISMKLMGKPCQVALMKANKIGTASSIKKLPEVHKQDL